MDSDVPYGTNNDKNAPEGQASIQDAKDSTHNSIELSAKGKPVRKILKIIGKIIKVVLIIFLCYLLVISTPLLLRFVDSELQEESTSLSISISVVISFCLTFAIIVTSVKRYQRLEQTADAQLNRKLLIYSIVGAISLAMLLMAVIILVNLIAQLVHCKGSSCAAWAVADLALIPVISFAALFIISVVKIVKMNRIIATQRDLDNGRD